MKSRYAPFYFSFLGLSFSVFVHCEGLPFRAIGHWLVPVDGHLAYLFFPLLLQGLRYPPVLLFFSPRGLWSRRCPPSVFCF